ncbi:redox-regulated ATPase YchF [Buchnera aphidicola]|uniref:redox-regulated ATPase YchF n=1 Tax=Buchnera aphidicola TaxID=9 RepID=UPI003463DC78
MAFKCGIIGLPNVGKSTLFNALTKGCAATENFPFCTIKPNIGMVPISDDRLYKIADIIGSTRIVKTCIEFVDIAGLVKGASQGEGLGNKFLNHIRDTDAIIHVVRFFDDPLITHIYGKIQPVNDIEIINIELCLSDLFLCESQMIKVKKRINLENSLLKKEILILERCISHLKEFNMLRTLIISSEEYLLISHLRLITLKPVMYVINTNNPLYDDNKNIEKIYNIAKKENSKVIPLSIILEADSIHLNRIEKNKYIKTLGLKKSGLDTIASLGYTLLKLHTFFTAGIKEVKAWTISKGTTAVMASGKIHSDFKKGFIRAQVISYSDFIKYKGFKKVKALGKIRSEGKNYCIQDGDIINFLFNI